MKALVLENNELRLRDWQLKEMAENQVKVQIHRAGICGTDLKLFQGSYFSTKKNKPVVLGHEFIGKVVEIGEKVTSVNINDRVSGHATNLTCGNCRYCRTGEFNLCFHKERIGFNHDGVFAEYAILNEDQLYYIPDEISEEAAVLIEPVSVAARAVNKVKLHPNQNVLLTGPGTIGLITLLVLKLFGCRVSVLGVETDKQRLELAKELGADETKIFRQLFSESGIHEYDSVFECSGHEAAVDYALQTIRPKGQYVQVGTSTKKVTIDFMKVAYKELVVTGSIGATREDWLSAIEFLKRIQDKAVYIIGKELSMDQWAEGFNNFHSSTKCPKTIFKI